MIPFPSLIPCPWLDFQASLNPPELKIGLTGEKMDELNTNRDYEELDFDEAFYLDDGKGEGNTKAQIRLARVSVTRRNFWPKF